MNVRNPNDKVQKKKGKKKERDLIAISLNNYTFSYILYQQ